MAERWWKGAAIYQIYPRSFTDSNGDGVGDPSGITAKLDYVASLGIDAIWLSPFFTSPMRDFGYDVANYCDVDPLFGSLSDFDALLKRAHDFGLKVVIDQVHSHTSDRHPWLEESRSNRENPKADWYVWAEAKPEGSPPNNWQSVFGGPAWEWDGKRGQCCSARCAARSSSTRARNSVFPKRMCRSTGFRNPEAIANWPHTLGRDGGRTPMPWAAAAAHLGFSTAEPWLPAADEHRSLAVDPQQQAAGSLLHFTRDCLNLRKRHHALREGQMNIIKAGGQVLSFERLSAGRTAPLHIQSFKPASRDVRGRNHCSGSRNRWRRTWPLWRSYRGHP